MEHKMKKRSYKLTFYNKNYNIYTQTHRIPQKIQILNAEKTKSYFIGSKKKKCTAAHIIR